MSEPRGERDANSGRGERLEVISDANWEEFCSAPAAVLVIAESGCEACRAWTGELRDYLERDSGWAHVRFGKIELDRAEAQGFTAANADWLRLVEGVPFNVLYLGGEPRTSFAGGGVSRIENRLRRYAAVHQHPPSIP